MHHKMSSDQLSQLPDRLEARTSEFEPCVVAARLDWTSKKIDVQSSGWKALIAKTFGWAWMENVKEDLNWHWSGYDGTRPFVDWLRESWDVNGFTPGIKVTSSLWIDVFPSVLCVGSWVRWREFERERTITEAMRRICFIVASCVGATEAMYAADSDSCAGESASNLMFDGKGYEEIKASIAREVGLPRPAIPSLSRSTEESIKLQESDRYYIDDFKDF